MDLTDEQAQILQQSRAMKEITASVHWKVYEQLLETWAETQRDKLLSPDVDMNMKEVAFVKGALAGLSLARTAPQSIIDHANEIIANRVKTESPIKTGEE